MEEKPVIFCHFEHCWICHRSFTVKMHYWDSICVSGTVLCILECFTDMGCKCVCVSWIKWLQMGSKSQLWYCVLSVFSAFVVKYKKMFSWLALVLSICMCICFIQLQCTELSGPLHIKLYGQYSWFDTSFSWRYTIQYVIVCFTVNLKQHH